MVLRTIHNISFSSIQSLFGWLIRRWARQWYKIIKIYRLFLKFNTLTLTNLLKFCRWIYYISVLSNSFKLNYISLQGHKLIWSKYQPTLSLNSLESLVSISTCFCLKIILWSCSGPKVDGIQLKWNGYSPDSKVHEANMGPTWVLSAPDGPHVGPMNLAIRVSSILMPDWEFPQISLLHCVSRAVIRIPSCSPAFYAAYMLVGHYSAIKLSASSSQPGLSEPADIWAEKEAAIHWMSTDWGTKTTLEYNVIYGHIKHEEG